MNDTDSEHALRLEMTALGKSLFDRGYAVGGAGNLSARLPDGDMLVTPTNSCLGRLDPAALSKVSREGKHISGAAPSKEFAFHLALYREKPECGAVAHLHSTNLVALSCLDNLDPTDVLRPFTPYYVMRVGRLPLLPYMRPGSPRIAEALAARARQGSAFLLANHGVVVTGKSLDEAVNNAEELEETAKLRFLLSGKAVRYFTQSEILELAPGADKEQKPACAM